MPGGADAFAQRVRQEEIWSGQCLSHGPRPSHRKTHRRCGCIRHANGPQCRLSGQPRRPIQRAKLGTVNRAVPETERQPTHVPHCGDQIPARPQHSTARGGTIRRHQPRIHRGAARSILIWARQRVFAGQFLCGARENAGSNATIKGAMKHPRRHYKDGGKQQSKVSTHW